MRSGLVSGQLALLSMLAAACPGASPNLCAGVTCAPGRSCVAGTCRDDLRRDGRASPYDQGKSTLDQSWFQRDGKVSVRLDGKEFDGGGTLDRGSEKVDKGVTDTAAKPDIDLGKWYQADTKNCPSHCTGLGKTNVPSVEGARCISGENRPKSAIDQGITFTFNCWSSCTAAPGAVNSSSSGSHCYRPSQKKDGDGTDLTVGCFCR